MAEVYARRLREIRSHRNWTQAQLAEAMARVGHPINRATIAKIEGGRRPLEVSEMVAFAAALDVEPAALYLEPTNGQVTLADGLTVDDDAAVAWAAGDAPLHGENRRTYLLESPRTSTASYSAALELGPLRRVGRDGE